MIYSPERKKKKQWLHNEYYESLLLHYPAIDSNLLTLLAADPPSSSPKWVLHFSSCFPYLCWVPTSVADLYEKNVDADSCPY
jgi:hypothetical protein